MYRKFSVHPFFVRITGLEPARRGHQNLNLARLPIPPYPHAASLSVCLKMNKFIYQEFRHIRKIL